VSLFQPNSRALRVLTKIRAKFEAIEAKLEALQKQVNQIQAGVNPNGAKY
jgi:hypothetical protein